MSIGSSGRIVIEVPPSIKRMLYSGLARDGLTLKDWFLKNVETYLGEGSQISLPFTPELNEPRAPDLTTPPETDKERSA